MSMHTENGRYNLKMASNRIKFLSDHSTKSWWLNRLVASFPVQNAPLADGSGKCNRQLPNIYFDAEFLCITHCRPFTKFGKKKSGWQWTELWTCYTWPLSLQDVSQSVISPVENYELLHFLHYYIIKSVVWAYNFSMLSMTNAPVPSPYDTNLAWIYLRELTPALGGISPPSPCLATSLVTGTYTFPLILFYFSNYEHQGGPVEFVSMRCHQTAVEILVSFLIDPIVHFL
jgi:hypothetical protein